MKYYVALVEGGVPKFSENPVAHEGRQAALAEATRLAKLHRGKTFRLYMESMIDPVMFPAEPKTYSFDELFTSAPTGTYKIANFAGLVGGADHTRFVALGTAGGQRAVLYTRKDMKGVLEAANRHYWGPRSFRYTLAESQLKVSVE